jgi:hypothetical protein
MAFQPVPLTVLAEVRMTLEGQNIENTLGFVSSAEWTIARADDLCVGLISWWTSLYADLVCSAVSLREVVVTDLSSDTGFQTSRAPSEPVAGTNTGEAMPNETAIVVSFRSSSRGRSARGRNYISGIPRVNVVANSITEDYASAITGAYDGLLDVAGDVSAFHCVISRFHDNAKRAEGVTFPITDYVITDLIVDSQRHRKPGVGS